MESAGWSFDIGNSNVLLDYHCGGGVNYYGWSNGNAVGTITSPPLVGSGNATVEFGNCWNAGSVKLYLNDELIDTAATDGSKGRAIQSKTFPFQAGDVVKVICVCVRFVPIHPIIRFWSISPQDL